MSDDIDFRRSSFCSIGACVEVADASDRGVVIRSSGDRAREVTFTREEWAAFVAGVKNGEFDT